MNSRPITNIPLGLLQLLGLKTNGANPDALGDTVLPTLDLSPFYLIRLAQGSNAGTHSVTLTSGGVNAAGFPPNRISVPDGELWYVHEYAVEAAVPAVAGDTVVGLRAILTYAPVAAGNYVQLGDEVSAVGVAANITGCASVARDFWAPPGSELGFFFGRILSVAGVAFTGRYLVTKLKV